MRGAGGPRFIRGVKYAAAFSSSAGHAHHVAAIVIAWPPADSIHCVLGAWKPRAAVLPCVDVSAGCDGVSMRAARGGEAPWL